MTFDVRTELLLDGVWTDVTSDIRQAPPITINRGRSDESSQTDPSTANLTFDNSAGDYSPRNPTGAHFGVLGRNTPLRVSTGGTAATYLAVAGNKDSYATAPDTAGLSVTGDLDVRLDVEPATWRPAIQHSLASKWTRTGNQRSWILHLTPGGFLQFNWSTDGIYNSAKVAVSTVAIPSTTERLAVRAILDVDTGLGGWAVRFYTAPTIGGSWTQLGAQVSAAGVTSVFDSTSDVRLGGDPFGWLAALSGRVYAFEYRNGVAGTVVASPTFTGLDTLITSLTDAHGNVWTLRGNTVVVDPNIRFHGEVSTWPQRWDPAGADVNAPVVASGVLRRLGQGAAPLKSVMYRGLTSLATDVVAYWPCEDDAGATELASALPGQGPLRVIGASPELAAFDSFKASKPIPTLNATRWSGGVEDYPVTGDMQVRCLLAVPAAGVAANMTLLRVFTTGSAARWDVIVTTAGELSLTVYDVDGAIINGPTAVSFGVDGRLLRFSLDATRISGSTISWNMSILEVGQGSGSTFNSTFGGSYSVNQVSRLVFNPAQAAEALAVGHVSVQNVITSLFDLSAELNAYAGEKATTRIGRLCAQESVPLQIVGDDAGTTTVGPQLPKTLLELLREAADADLGILYEPRGFLGLAYRPRGTLYAQAPVLELDYATADMAGIEPTDDDQATRNDVTVKRVDGASARAVLETGPLSVNAPPDGVGRYDEEVTLNLATDAQAPDQASWRLYLGTVDEARYPKLGINLASSSFTADATLTADAVALDVGDKVTVANPPAWLPPDLINQLTQGMTETLGRYEWLIDVNCSPASPWDVAVYDAASGPGEARYSSDGSSLSAGATATATTISVATPSGPLWGAVDQPFDIYVAGERMTVTAVSGASSPQTFTVTRSVNGVVKAQTSGTEVRLYKPAYYAL